MIFSYIKSYQKQENIWHHRKILQESNLQSRNKLNHKIYMSTLIYHFKNRKLVTTYRFALSGIFVYFILHMKAKVTVKTQLSGWRISL